MMFLCGSHLFNACLDLPSCGDQLLSAASQERRAIAHWITAKCLAMHHLTWKDAGSSSTL
eukprot:237028-Amphidinium_carterae.1